MATVPKPLQLRTKSEVSFLVRGTVPMYLSGIASKSHGRVLRSLSCIPDRKFSPGGCHIDIMHIPPVPRPYVLPQHRPLPLHRVAPTPPPRSQVYAVGQGDRMLSVATQLMADGREVFYTHRPDIDPGNGIVACDCSELVDYLASKVAPGSLARIPVDPGFDHPRAWDFYTYFRTLPSAPAPGLSWSKVGQPADLRPGDVIAWQHPGTISNHADSGHVMLVAGPPQAIRQDATLLGYDVPVIDATSHGHGPGDSRGTTGTGLGRGTIFLPTGSDGRPTGFSWTPYGAPGALPPRPPSLAFGRLVGWYEEPFAGVQPAL